MLPRPVTAFCNPPPACLAALLPKPHGPHRAAASGRRSAHSCCGPQMGEQQQQRPQRLRQPMVAAMAAVVLVMRWARGSTPWWWTEALASRCASEPACECDCRAGCSCRLPGYVAELQNAALAFPTTGPCPLSCGDSPCPYCECNSLEPSQSINTTSSPPKPLQDALRRLAHEHFPGCASGFRRSRRPMFGSFVVLLALQKPGLRNSFTIVRPNTGKREGAGLALDRTGLWLPTQVGHCVLACVGCVHAVGAGLGATVSIFMTWCYAWAMRVRGRGI